MDKKLINPETDYHVGNFYDLSSPTDHEIDVYYSKTEGYYRTQRITQKRKGRTWENITFEESVELSAEMDALSLTGLPEGCRYIETMRPLDSDEILRTLVDLAIPDHGDLRERFHKSLDAGGCRRIP